MSKTTKNKPLLITTGEPAGIGPDLCLLLVAEEKQQAVLLGDGDLLRERARQLGLDLDFSPLKDHFEMSPSESADIPFIHIPLQKKVTPGKPDTANVPYLLAMHERAVELCRQKNSPFAALVTSPTDKGLIQRTGVHFSDLTQHLGELSGTRESLSIFCGDVAWGRLLVSFITMHLPLAEVSSRLSPELIRAKIRLSRQAMQEVFGISEPKLALCGLNPHAGEDGFLGKEEKELIQPVADELREEGMKLQGPLSADSLFAPAILSAYDMVIAFYHDQGLAPFKALCFGRGAQLTYGLPFLRTSPDHGTAYALSGTRTMNGGSMKKAAKLARQLGKKKE